VRIGRSAGLTDTGRKRRRNEDAFVLAPPLFAVADGMGGAQAGEVASKLAASALAETDHGQLRGEEGVDALIQEANRRVFSRASEDPAASGMGTTITVALVEDGHVVVGHVGDSRAYLVREGKMEQLTEDHSLVNELLKTGKLSREEAETHPQRSVITRALGTDPDVDVDTFTIEAHEGDVFLLCSDGLTSMVDDETILSLVDRNRTDLERATHALVDEANRGGGEDNITVVAFEIVPGSDEQAIEETVQMPASGDDEDTLSGLERMPAVDTMVVPAGEIAAFAEDPPTREQAVPAGVRRRDESQVSRGARLRLVLAMVLMLLVAAGLVVWGLLR
jgi:PPM family protein phosphatase